MIFDLIMCFLFMVSFLVFGFTLVEALNGDRSFDTFYLVSLFKIIHIKCKYGVILFITSLLSYSIMLCSIFYFI